MAEGGKPRGDLADTLTAEGVLGRGTVLTRFRIRSFGRGDRASPSHWALSGTAASPDCGACSTACATQSQLRQSQEAGVASRGASQDGMFAQLRSELAIVCSELSSTPPKPTAYTSMPSALASACVR